MTPSRPSLSKRELFMGFLKIGISGFGGVLPHARRQLVDEHAWLDDREFTEILSIGQGLPGPNIVNMSVVIGSRFQGWRGALCAVCGLMLAPFIIVLSLAALYERFAYLPALNHALAGIAAVAAGLIIGTGVKLAHKNEHGIGAASVLLAAFLAVTWLRLPLLLVLGVLAPVSIGLAWRAQSHEVEKSSLKDAR